MAAMIAVAALIKVAKLDRAATRVN